VSHHACVYLHRVIALPEHIIQYQFERFLQLIGEDKITREAAHEKAIDKNLFSRKLITW